MSQETPRRAEMDARRCRPRVRVRSMRASGLATRFSVIGRSLAPSHRRIRRVRAIAQEYCSFGHPGTAGRSGDCQRSRDVRVWPGSISPQSL
jgi:hypothetical protein